MRNVSPRISFCIMLGSIIFFASRKPAIAHHGGASASFGPGSPIETTAPFTLPEGSWLLFNRFEVAPYEKYSRNNPDNVDVFTFNTAMLGYGIKNSLSAYVMLPYSKKEQDRLGVSSGFGDIEFLLQYGFKYGVKNGITGWYIYGKDDVVGKKYTINDYKFTLFGGLSIPTGTISNQSDVDDDRDGNKDTFDMGMQPGFGASSFNFGIAASKLLTEHITLTADTSIRAFAQQNDGKSANEIRGNIALGYELYEAKKAFITRVDILGEVNFIHLGIEQDRNRVIDSGAGGNILYLSPAVRFTFYNRFSVGLMLKIPSILDLNKQGEQQGSEGLEKYRLIATASLSF